MTTTKRGRPRPQETIRRDGKIFDLLKANGPMTRNQVAEKAHLSPSLAYLSLTRLKESGRIRRCLDEGTGDSIWTTGVDIPCP